MNWRLSFADGGYCYGTWFTDHLSMIKIDGRWRIVAKTFYAHPPGY
jgi:hypothetical protein